MFHSSGSGPELRDLFPFQARLPAFSSEDGCEVTGWTVRFTSFPDDHILHALLTVSNKEMISAQPDAQVVNIDHTIATFVFYTKFLTFV